MQIPEAERTPHRQTSKCAGPNMSGCQCAWRRHSNGDGHRQRRQEVKEEETEGQGAGCRGNKDLVYSEVGSR